jgi:ribosomal protein S18 acetylase RimI-like enzyme
MLAGWYTWHMPIIQGVEVRRGVVGDVPRILPLVGRICAFHHAIDPRLFDYLDDVLDRYERWLPERAVDPKSVLLVAREVGKAGNEGKVAGTDLIGFAVATVEAEVPIYHLREYGFIHDTWVEPAWRGRGIGRALIEETLLAFTQMGVAQVRLDTARGNDAARALFSGLGFREGVMRMVRDMP